MEPTELISGANAALVALVLMLTGALKMIFDDFFSSELGQRLLPIVPIILGVVGALVGISDADATLKEQVISGLLSGISAAVAYKVGKTSLLGKGLSDPEGK